jgi:hypothetical protein
VCVRLDVEAFVERVIDLAKKRKTQSLYKLNNRTDILGLEPEYGLARALVERFAELSGPHLMLYTKGASVDHLVDLDHRGQTVASFTLTPDPVAKMLEQGAPPPSERIRAMERMFVAGYPVRVRFSPIVPIRGWRDAYADLIRRVFSVARPELITLWTLSMVDFDELDQIVPPETLDEGAHASARDAAGEMQGQKGAPFPPTLRASISRELVGMIRTYSSDTHVSLCLETPEVWAATGPLVGDPHRRGGFLCNCGPLVTPDALVRG